MKRFISIIGSITLCNNIIFGCTSAIISGSKTWNGHPLLWKHRDSGHENNIVERIPARNNKLAYVALFNADDKKREEAWIGYNSTGFAIMNTASYNLKDDKIPNNEMDKEGYIMTKALQHCHNIADFEKMLKNLPKPLGVEANFGVIDAEGNGAYFETKNDTFHKYDLKDAPDGILIRTNYSHSDQKDKGAGYIREQSAKELIMPYAKKRKISASILTEKVSRIFYHSLLHKDFTKKHEEWIWDQDFIPRNSSSATCVVEGVSHNENPELTTMWAGIGYPPCSEIRAAWIWSGGIPEELEESEPNGHSRLCDEANEKKRMVFPLKRGNEKKYVHIEKLYNRKKTGFCQILIKKNKDTYKKGYNILKSKRKLVKKVE